MRNQRKILRWWGLRGKGQALAEFALVVPVFMLLVGGIIQFGILFWGQNTLTQIVRDAGRYAATVKDCTTAYETDIVSKTQAIAAQSSLTGTLGTVNVTFSTSPCFPRSNTDVDWVTIQAQAQVPVFFPLVSGQISTSATFRMEPIAQ